jgi:outer membrane protein
MAFTLSTLLRGLCLMGGCALACATAAEAESEIEGLPLWEFGLGVGALALNDYRGADTAQIYPIPIPYFVFRGQFLRADRDGVRGVFFNRDLVEINVSVNATTPVESRNTRAREGMPNLKPTVEIGPSIDWHLWRSDERRVRLDFRMPLRTAVTVEDSPHSIGWFFAPRLTVDFIDIGAHSGWNIGLLAGPLFASRRYNQYFYTVAPEYSRPDRPAYQAPGGFAGSEVLTSLSRRFPGFWVGAFVRYDTLSGAGFADSPLVRTNGYWAAGIGIAWMIGKSSKMVAATDAD